MDPDALRAVATLRSQFGQISRVLRRIHKSCSSPINVEDLAREAHMSVSAFHHAFKTITLTSPIQYIKSMRLHVARRLMAHEGNTAAAAAAQVGYESASQFSREFNLFGCTPIEEAERARVSLG